MSTISSGSLIGSVAPQMEQMQAESKAAIAENIENQLAHVAGNTATISTKNAGGALSFGENSLVMAEQSPFGQAGLQQPQNPLMEMIQNLLQKLGLVPPPPEPPMNEIMQQAISSLKQAHQQAQLQEAVGEIKEKIGDMKEAIGNMKQAQLPKDPTKMSDDQAKNVLMQEFDNADVRAFGGDRDGVIGKADLEKIAGDEGADPHLREAASRALNDKDFTRNMNLHGADSDDVGLSKESIQTSRAEDAKDAQAASVLAENFDSADIRAFGGDRDGVIGEDDLKKLASDETEAPELRAAAQRMLDQGIKSVTQEQLGEIIEE